MKALALLGLLLASIANASPNFNHKQTHLTVNSNTLSTCPVTVGSLTLRVSQPRTTGSDHLVVFYNATATTDSTTLGGANNAFQDVYYSWNFGDTGASGTGTWPYGSNPNVNSMNSATGAVASHLYIVPDGQGDTSFTATVSATDGTNTATCLAPQVTVYDATGSNGFPTTATVCVFNASVGSGCPTGAATLTASTFSALNANIGGKRYLFKCGDTFSGDNYTTSGVKARAGAYGGCQSTKTNRPIFSGSGTNHMIQLSPGIGDLVMSDIDFHGNGTESNAIYQSASPFLGILYQVTLYNLNTTGTSGAFGYTQGAQYAIINSAMQNMRSSIGVYFNIWENNPPYSGNTINNLDYAAAIGNLFNGTGNTSTGAGQEVFRISSCRYCVISSNTIENANNVGGVLKIHEGNTYASCGVGFTGPPCPSFPCTVGGSFVNTNCWVGAYTELLEVSDNWFGGTSGGVSVDIEPQSSAREEHLRNIVFERNIYAGSLCCQGSPGQMRTSVVNLTIRDNVFYDIAGSSTQYPQYALNIGQLGLEPVPTGVEVFNNACYMPNPQDNAQVCFAFGGLTLNAAANNSFGENNLFYAASGTHTMFVNNGTGNTLSNNSGNSAGNPAFTNGSGTFTLSTDFKPTANFSGGTSLPVFYDALGIAWAPAWDLGAVHH